ncbi:ribosome recycling factor [Ferrovibrio sp.]|uniref:ribosome recycling factor n=1 Tax=Ferrovibrio sp. TaxID=1917215 RepID=UPI003D14805A
MAEPDIDDIERRMNKAIDVLKQEYAGLRTGRASISMLDPVRVDVYGSTMPINQVGTISVPEPRMISVSVWDKSNVKAVEKAIAASGLGLNPQADGTLIRIPIPELNEQRRKELSKVAGQYAEQAKVAVRGVRRDGMDSLKKLEKDHEIGEDDAKMWQEEIQRLTDEATKKIDEMLAGKSKEIMQV